MALVYKITNTKNNKSYIGICVAEGKTYLDRFAEHMRGDGGVWILRDIESGNASPSDFISEMIEESDDITYIKAQEDYYIKLYNTYYPNGYNGNVGNYIIRTPETTEKARQTRAINFAEGKHKSTKGLYAGTANYRYPDGTVKKLPIDHEDVLNKVVVHANVNENAKYRIEKKAIDEQKLKNG